MCGISGLVGIDSPETAARMVEVQAHRGPDDTGLEKLSQSPPLYFGHNRLSIIDLSHRGHQPMFSEDGSLCVIHNGEVYNFREIRKELESYGYNFFSRTDTEVILKAYERWGIECLEKFNGMFAFAIHDRRTNRLILARDRLGIKPLYYWHEGARLAFASEIKALLQVGEVRKAASLDMESFVSYVSLLWTPYTKTPFTAIHRLPPGTYMEFDLEKGKQEIRQYWKLEVKEENVSLTQAAEKVLELLKTSVRRRMIADVRVGAFLSGGIDSSAIAVLMADSTSEPVEAFTIAFTDEDQKVEAMMDDYRYARMLSERHGFRLHRIEITAQQTAELLPKIIYHLDEPVGDAAAVNTYLMAELARERGVTILLSGQGSDEIFGGYRKFLACTLLEKYKRMAPKLLQQMVESAVNKLPVALNGRGIRHTRWLKKFILDKPDDNFGLYFSLSMSIDTARLRRLLAEDVFRHFTDRIHRQFFESVNSSYMNRMCYADTMLFLPGLNLNYCDKATMAASLECRVPFLDHELVEYAFSLPVKWKLRRFTEKYVLKKAMEGVLPARIINRPKMPFSSPIRSWVKKENGLMDMIDEYLEPGRLRKQGFFDPEGVRTLIDEDRRGLRDNAHILFELLTMQLWLDRWEPMGSGLTL
ncbi:MAG: asparagine synthase (glutamine-hydrolyzing) [Candidatus Aminicenantales bacterium]